MPKPPFRKGLDPLIRIGLIKTPPHCFAFWCLTVLMAVGH
jgi:hypothetical protein